MNGLGLPACMLRFSPGSSATLCLLYSCFCWVNLLSSTSFSSRGLKSGSGPFLLLASSRHNCSKGWESRWVWRTATFWGAEAHFL